MLSTFCSTNKMEVSFVPEGTLLVPPTVNEYATDNARADVEMHVSTVNKVVTDALDKLYQDKEGTPADALEQLYQDEEGTPATVAGFQMPPAAPSPPPSSRVRRPTVGGDGVVDVWRRQERVADVIRPDDQWWA